MDGVDGVAGFRFATVADGRSRDGRPAGPPADPRLRSRQLQYLRTGTALLENTTVAGPDLLDPAQPAAVPCGYRTDGTWIWPEALAYYLDRHALAIPTDLEQTALDAGHYSPRVTRERAGLAREAVWQHGPGPFEPVAPPQTRFPREVYDVLVSYGWLPGRTVAATVDPWLDQLDLSAYGPSPALVARAAVILREFGGLVFPISGPGRDWPVVPFTLYPGQDGPNLLRLWAASQHSPTPLYPLGSVADWAAEIVLDETGRIFASGDEHRYLGEGIDAALVALLRGRRPGALR